MKKYYAIFLLLVLFVSTWAVDANEFLIGAYSQYQIRYSGNDYIENFDSLRVYLYNAGYNATVYGSAYDYPNGLDYTDRIPNIFETLENNGQEGIKSMLFDNAWSPSSGKVGVSTLAFGNRLKIEAEYELKTSDIGSFEIDNLSTSNQLDCLESYDYVTKHECGAIDNNLTMYSNENSWVCDQSEGHLPGIALSHPRKRWKPSDQSWPRMLSDDIVFNRSAINDNKLYLTVAMRFENVTTGDAVADVKLKFYNPPIPDEYSEYIIPDPSDYEEVTLIPVNSIYDVNILAQTYPPTMQDTPYRNYLFEYYVDLSACTSYMTHTGSHAAVLSY